MISEFFCLAAEDKAEVKSATSQVILNQLPNKQKLEPIFDLQDLTDGQGAFVFEQGQLSLHLLLEKKLTRLAFDFSDGEVGFRAARVNKSNELVSRALGCKPYYRPSVLDATAGMGRDSLIMALLGCQVTMHERNPAIYLLLENALARFKQSPHYQTIAGSLSLDFADSLESKKIAEEQQYDVIYLDPMFPERKKSALVKKEMRLFKLLAGEDPDADLLLENAMQKALKRVVVKRPKGAPALAGKKPSHEIVAKKFRYDVYIVS